MCIIYFVFSFVFTFLIDQSQSGALIIESSISQCDSVNKQCVCEEGKDCVIQTSIVDPDNGNMPDLGDISGYNIICPQDYKCTINCFDVNYCQHIKVNAEHSSKLNVVCHAENSCNRAEFKFPDEIDDNLDYGTESVATIKLSGKSSCIQCRFIGKTDPITTTSGNSRHVTCTQEEACTEAFFFCGVKLVFFFFFCSL